MRKKRTKDKTRQECFKRLMDMRGQDHQRSGMFSCCRPSRGSGENHPLQVIRAMADEDVGKMSKRFDAMLNAGNWWKSNRFHQKLLPSAVDPDAVLGCSERLLMEGIDYSLLFRWFVGMNLDEAVWDA